MCPCRIRSCGARGGRQPIPPALSARCESGSVVRSGSMPAAAAPTAPTRPTTVRCRSASWCPGPSRTPCRRSPCAGSTARRWYLGRRHQPGRAGVQRGGRRRLVQVLPRRRLGRSRGADLRGRARHRARRAQRAAGAAPADVRPEACHARPLHAGRHDRQQLVRGHGAGLRQDRGQRAAARGPHLPRGAVLGRADQRRGVGGHRGGRRRPGRDLPAAPRAGAGPGRGDKAAIPGYPAAGIRLQPGLATDRAWVRRGPGPGRQREHAGHDPARGAPPGA